MARISFGKFEGDRESKAADVLVDGVVVGHIDRINAEGFQTASSRARTMRFYEVELVIYASEADHTWHADDGYDSRSAVKAAKSKARELLA